MSDATASGPSSRRPRSSSGSYADRTLAAYGARAPRVIANWGRFRAASAYLRLFGSALPRAARVLDYGCGIGTDLAWLAKRGFRVEGLDGTAAFVQAARRRVPGVVIREARFEDVRLPAGRYDGIWCNAALLHVPPRELRRQVRMLRRALAARGILGLTLAWGRIRAHTRRDWIPDRYIAGYSKTEVGALFRGWELFDLRAVSDTGRQGRWVWVLARR